METWIEEVTKEVENTNVRNLCKELLSQNVWFMKGSENQLNHGLKVLNNDFHGEDKSKSVIDLWKFFDCSDYIYYSYYLWKIGDKNSEVKEEVKELFLTTPKVDGWEDFASDAIAQLNCPYRTRVLKSASKEPVWQLLNNRLKQQKNAYSIFPLSLPLFPWPFESWIERILDRKAYIASFIYNELTGSNRTQIIYANDKDNLFLQLNHNVSTIFIDNYAVSSGEQLSEKEVLNALRTGSEFLTEDGIFVIHNLGVYDRELTKYLIDNGLLESIFLSPSLGGNVLIVSKQSGGNKYHDAKEFKYITVNNANDNFYDEYIQIKSVSYEKIVTIGYSLDSSILDKIDELIPYEKSDGEKDVTTNDILERYKCHPHKDQRGRIFSEKNLATNYESFYCQPEQIEEGCVDASFRKVVDHVLVMHPVMSRANPTYVMASEENPVYFDSTLWVICRVKEDVILPSYIYYLFKNEILTNVAQVSDSFIGGVYPIAVDDEGEVYGCDMCEGGLFYKGNIVNERPENLRNVDRRAWGEWNLFNNDKYFPLPAFDEQKKKVVEARLIWKIMENQEYAQKKLLEEQEWLNEQHIRNIKHRLRDELTPIHIGLERILDLMDKSNGVLHGEDFYSKRNGRTVSLALKSLFENIKQVEKSIGELTEINQFHEGKSCNINRLLEVYEKKHIETFDYELKIKPSVVDFQINISQEDMNELLNCLLENAIRHGFIDSNRTDYRVQIEASIMPSGEGKLVVSNNGQPFSERAREIYFIRGNYTGKTGNSGVGGARVKEIVEHFGGTIKLGDGSKDFPVKIEMTFPIEKIN